MRALQNLISIIQIYSWLKGHVHYDMVRFESGKQVFRILTVGRHRNGGIIMPKCECGCGEESKHEFLPGHDQRLRTSLEHRVGGILSLKTLVEVTESYANGEISDENFTQVVRKVFAAVRRA